MMNTKDSNSFKERGQILIIFVFSLMGLFMLLTLVLDGGLMLVRRREAQNSSDAGALAGATFICDSPTTSDYTAARNSAIQYAVDYNQATSIVVTFPGTNSIEVVSTIVQSPAIAGLFGIENINVEALARAQCVPAGSSTGGLMPFVVPCKDPNGELVQDGNFEACLQVTVADPNNPVFPNDYYLIHNSDPADDEFDCIVPPNSSVDAPDYISGFWDCDIDNDGIDDISDNNHKAWVSLEAGEKPSSENLIDWILNGTDNEISTHLWLGGKPGVNDDIFTSVKQLADPDYPIVIFPVFSALCNGPISDGGQPIGVLDPEIECPSLWHPDDSALISEGRNRYYHIIAFAAFQITCVHSQGGDSCDFRNYIDGLVAEDKFTNGDPKTIEGYFIKLFDPDLGGGIGLNTGTFVITLVR